MHRNKVTSAERYQCSQLTFCHALNLDMTVHIRRHKTDRLHLERSPCRLTGPRHCVVSGVNIFEYALLRPASQLSGTTIPT